MRGRVDARIEIGEIPFRQRREAGRLGDLALGGLLADGLLVAGVRLDGLLVGGLLVADLVAAIFGAVRAWARRVARGMAP